VAAHFAARHEVTGLCSHQSLMKSWRRLRSKMATTQRGSAMAAMLVAASTRHQYQRQK